MATTKFQKGQSGNPAGRKKGVPNKITIAAKDAIASAADQLGGADRIVAWAREDPRNESAFWTTIYPKLMPLQVQGDPNHPIGISLIERIIVRPSHSDS